MYEVKEFNQWSVPVSDSIAAGSREVTVENAQVTIVGRETFTPFAVDRVVHVDDGGLSEDVTITAVDTDTPGRVLVTATFANAHRGGFKFRSATAGLQESIDYVAQHGGGTVTADSADLDDIVTDPTVTVITDGGGVDNVSANYDAASSYQPKSVDLTLAADAGKSTGTAFLASFMGNLFGAALTKTKNYLGALIGHYSITGSGQSTYPKGAVLAGIGDGSTDADGAVVAYVDGDSEITTARAAYKVRCNNSTAASGFDYGVDLQDAAHDGYQPVTANFAPGGTQGIYKKGVVRLVQDVVFLVGAGAPTNGVTGADNAGPGSLYINVTNKKIYINTNTKASPTWGELAQV